MLGTPRGEAGGSGDGGNELSALRAQIAGLEGEKEMRIKLEKLLEVQTVQVDLQKELRVKTESLLQVEQQANSKLRQQVEDLRRAPGPGMESRLQLEDRYAEAQSRIRTLEKQLAEGGAPETSDRVESQLKAQLEEQERLIKRLQEQMDGRGRQAAGGDGQGDVVRLQLLLQSKDKHLDELNQTLRKAQNEAAEALSETDVLRHQVRVLKKEVSERTEEMEKQLGTERTLRADIFQMQAKLEQAAASQKEESQRAANFAETAAFADERQRRIDQLEKQLAEEQTTAKREREQLAAESEFRIHAKEQTIKHQTSTIESLNKELKEKQAEVDKLMRSGMPDSPQATVDASRREQERGGLLPPLQPPSPRGDDNIQGQRSIESLHRQIKGKDAKIAKQSERLQALAEILEKRDQELEDLRSAKRDREQMQHKVTEMEEVMKAQPRVVSHAEAERRLIEQETRMRDNERKTRDVEDELRQEKAEKEELARELGALRSHLAEGASSQGALQDETSRLSRELAEVRRVLDARNEENRRLREAQAVAQEEVSADPVKSASLPAMQRRLQKLEEVDKPLSRDVAVWLQERENKIDSLNSTISLLRTSLDDARKTAEKAQAAADRSASLPAPGAPQAEAGMATASTVALDSAAGPVGGSTRDISLHDVGTGTMGAPAQDAATSPRPESPRELPTTTIPARELAASAGPSASVLGQDAQRTPVGGESGRPGGDSRVPLGQDAARQAALRAPLSAPAPQGRTQMPVVVNNIVTTEDVRGMTTDEIRSELLSRRQDVNNLEAQLEEKKQLVLKLIEEANLCNAEVASLQQTVQQAYKAARKHDREYEKVVEEKTELEATASKLQQELAEKEMKLSKMFHEHQQETSGNATVDEVDRLGWKIKVMTPRQHEIRHSVFLVLNRRQTEQLDKVILAQGLAHHFAISPGRIEIVEDARLPDTTGDPAQAEIGDRESVADSVSSPEHVGTPTAGGSRQLTQQMMDKMATSEDFQTKRDLVLVNISDAETNEAGQILRSTITALDVLDQVRNDMIKGHRLGPIDGVALDAVFINHGDMILPFEWPSAQAQLLLREGRLLAGKHAVITVHEVRDPYILRVVAYDTEVGREFVLYLHTRDVMLLLDTRDSEAAQSMAEANGVPDQVPYRHLEGPSVQLFRQAFTVSEGSLLDVVVSSLSFSVWQNQQILVASEMRIPLPPHNNPDALLAIEVDNVNVAASIRHQKLDLTMPSTDGPRLSTTQPALLPDVGVTRGLRPQHRVVRRLFEDVVGFEGRLCIFSVIHTTTGDLSEDMLRAAVYYPKTSAHVEACLHQPLLSDRLRIVAEAGELDADDDLSVSIVVEEIVYPPAFVVRLTSVTMSDCPMLSKSAATKPHSHIIRVTKDGSNAVHLPDMSFAVSRSTIRSKLLQCIGLSTPVQGPRETLLTMPRIEEVLGPSADNVIMRRAVTGHVNEKFGLTLQLVSSKKKTGLGVKLEESERAAGAMPAAMRAQLRAKYGKGRLLVRHGRMLNLRGSGASNAIRAVVSVYERAQPYQHFVTCAYEPQTSREWEVLADSIDIFKLFTDHQERRSQALDMGNPATREQLAEVLVDCVELVNHEEELMLVVSPEAIKAHVEKKRASLKDSSKEPEVTGDEDDRRGSARDSSAARLAVRDALQVSPAITNVATKAIAGFAGGSTNRETELTVEQRGRDRLFTAQRRLPPSGRGQGELYKICIYDDPGAAALHSYRVLATPLHKDPLAASGLPLALLADPSKGDSESSAPPNQAKYMLRVNDQLLEDFLWDTKLMEPARQEELLNYITQSLHLDEDRNGQLRLSLRKKKLRQHQIPEAMAQVGETGGKAPSAHMVDSPSAPGQPSSREVGGNFPLNMLRVTANKESPQGPSLHGHTHQLEFRSLMLPGWKKVYSMAQRFGHATVIITVSKRDHMYKLSVYEPEASNHYEMSLVTSCSATPLNVLIERCDLGGKLDLMLCMHEQAFPHQVAFCIIHLPSNQEFNLKIGDDLVYTMIENSRRDAFMLYFEQLLNWGCIGLTAAVGGEEQQLSSVFEDTFAGNQIFDRSQIEDVLQSEAIVGANGELKPPVALAPNAPKKLRVPVIRTQLDFLGKRQPPPAGITMNLLYHVEHFFHKEAQTLLMRVHKRVRTNDIAVTLRVRTDEGLALPQPPNHHMTARGQQACAANGRPFETPALASGEASGSQPSELTIWLQDKCSRAPSGAYGEICEVPGFAKPVILLITDEDSPRAIRIVVTLAQLPFTVLFQVVLLETSETTAKVETGISLKASSSRKVLQQTFHRYFGNKAGGGSSSTMAVQTHFEKSAEDARDRDLKQKLDDLENIDAKSEHLGIEKGPGAGGPLTSDMQSHESVDVSIIFMCTRRKMGRMMVFTIYRDIVSHNMYLRVVMHDPVAKKDSHLTLLHYTTQRLLSILRINRDMLEECSDGTPHHVKQERQQLRVELGKLIVSHLFIQRAPDKEGRTEAIDHLEAPEDEDIEYELHMHDIMDSSNSMLISEKRKVLSSMDGPKAIGDLESSGLLRTQSAGTDGGSGDAPPPPAAEAPKTLLDTKEDALVHKAEKDVSGRRVLITFYNETTREDILSYSHNIRVVVACVQTLNVLAMQDFHEDTLELVCERRGKRHLMSATREQDLVKELWECLVIQHVGQKVTGITFGGIER